MITEAATTVLKYRGGTGHRRFRRINASRTGVSARTCRDVAHFLHCIVDREAAWLLGRRKLLELFGGPCRAGLRHGGKSHRREDRPAQCRTSLIFLFRISPARCSPSASSRGVNSSPQANSAASSPPRAANSHSARSAAPCRPRRHSLGVSVSAWTTGWSSSASSELSGAEEDDASRRRDWNTHQSLRRLEVDRTAVRREDQRRRNASSPAARPDSLSGSGGISAKVTWPVSSTKRRNSRFVTGVRSIQKPSTRAKCEDASSKIVAIRHAMRVIVSILAGLMLTFAGPARLCR